MRADLVHQDFPLEMLRFRKKKIQKNVYFNIIIFGVESFH